MQHHYEKLKNSPCNKKKKYKTFILYSSLFACILQNTKLFAIKNSSFMQLLLPGRQTKLLIKTALWVAKIIMNEPLQIEINLKVTSVQSIYK